MENVALNHGVAAQLDAVRANAPLDHPADRQLLRDNLAFHCCPFVYRYGQSPYFSFDLAQYVDSPLANNFADYSNAATDRGDLIVSVMFRRFCYCQRLLLLCEGKGLNAVVGLREHSVLLFRAGSRALRWRRKRDECGSLAMLSRQLWNLVAHPADHVQ